ncbi:uroporphyrinogen-III C-methyltransferase [uncultured Abyssibacter sp.]|uniref:uroporphyrinogen-III C-methyltransferase n=1 Tax=uncultured Abyssibacter sp. TaxID=2320202 RepID=UPI0032B1F601
MTDSAADADSPKRQGSELVPYSPGEHLPPPVRTGRPIAWTALVITLLNLVILGFAAALAWQFGLPYMERSGVRVDSMRERVADQSRDLERHGERLASLEAGQGDFRQGLRQREQMLDDLGERTDTMESAIASLTTRVEGGRRLWQLNELEHLLLIANERLQLSRDLDAAQAALVLAEERAAAMNDPALFDARNLIASEIAAVRNAPRVDRQSIALRISSLIRQVPGLPVERNVPEAFQPGDGRPPVEGPVADAGRRAWQKLREIANKMFVIHRTEEAVHPLLPPEQAYFLKQNLILQLETARLAVLQSDGANFRDAINEARAWTERYFDAEDRGVTTAIEQLDALAGGRVRTSLPDISASLEAVRAVTERRRSS